MGALPPRPYYYLCRDSCEKHRLPVRLFVCIAIHAVLFGEHTEHLAYLCR